jgi:ribosome-associated toxin RatA of RatAB toxin-antitoxin module
VPRYGNCQTEIVAAPAQACFDALTDYERLPEWQGAVRAVEVLERDERGRGRIVDYEVDVKLKTVSYRLRQVYDEPRRLGSEDVGGDFRDFSGEWRFEARADGTTCVELDLDIDPGRFVPGPLRAAIREFVMTRALSDLKRHVEAAAPAT